MTHPRNNIRYVRYAVKLWFLLVTLFVGWQFYQFVLHFEAPGHPFVQRPPSVDAFLPIGGLKAFKFFAVTGIVEPLHPSGLILFIAITGVSLFLKKGFCGCHDLFAILLESNLVKINSVNNIRSYAVQGKIGCVPPSSPQMRKS